MDELEEITCPICTTVFNDRLNLPMLLPSCGHSYCLQCIKDKSSPKITEKPSLDIDIDLIPEVDQPSDDLLLDDTNAEDLLDTKKSAEKSKPCEPEQLMFVCPEDQVECVIKDPAKMPKNFAMLKILQKHAQSKIKTVQANFDLSQNEFVAEVKKQNSLATFLTKNKSSKSSNTLALTPESAIKEEEKKVTPVPGRVTPGPITPKQSSGPSKFLFPSQFTPYNANQEPQTMKKPRFQDRFRQARRDIEVTSKPVQAPEPPKPKPPTIGTCQEHQRLQELICLDDKRRVCAHCALFGSHRGHDVREESEVKQQIDFHTDLLTKMFDQMCDAQTSLSDSSAYWKYFNQYREKQTQIKEEIQSQFKTWRKTLRSIEMNVLDKLHTQQFAQFEEAFQKAKFDNSKLISDAENYKSSIQNLLEGYEEKAKHNSRHVDYELLNAEEIDLRLTRGEAMIESINKDKDYKTVSGLDAQYNKIKIVFEQNFDSRVANLCRIIGHQQPDKSSSQLSVSGSVELTNPETLLSFAEDGDRSHGAIQPPKHLDISRISFNDEEQKLFLQKKTQATTPQNHGQKPPTIRQGIAAAMAAQDSDQGTSQGRLGLGSQGNNLSGIQDNNQFYEGEMSTETADTMKLNRLSCNASGGTHQLMGGLKRPGSSNMLFGAAPQGTSQGSRRSSNSKHLQPSAAVNFEEPPMTHRQEPPMTNRQKNRNSSSLMHSDNAKTLENTDNNDYYQMSNSKLAQTQGGGAPLISNEQKQAIQSQRRGTVMPGSTPSGLGGLKRTNTKGAAQKGGAISTAFKTQIIDQNLSLTSKNLGDSHINEIVRNLKVYNGLKGLDLSGNKISDDGVQHLARAICETQVDVLIIANNKLTDKCTEPLAGILRTNKQLKVLNLEGNGITNRVAKNKLKNSLSWVDTRL